MRKIISFLLLSLISISAFATGGDPDPIIDVPEPEVLSLLAVGVMAFFASRRKAK